MALNLDLNKPLAVVGVILGAIVALLLLAAFLPSMFNATSGIVDAFSAGSTGNDLADTLLPIFGVIIALVVVVGIVGLVIKAVAFD